jgi:hypothetical protein
MSDEQTTAPEEPTGGSQPETTPEVTEGQAEQGTTPTETPPETFFDPQSVPEELQPAYKQMQSAFTKKMQRIADSRKKIEAYDAFSANPIAEMQRLAEQYGYQLSPYGQQQTQGQEPQEPQTWDDVYKVAEERAMAKLEQRFAPLLQQVTKMKQNDIERQLSAIDPTWQQYEDDMRSNLKQHPSLANDPAMLYRVSVPQEVLESKATQAALKKMEQKGQATKVSGTSTTTKQPGGFPNKAMSFNEAVRQAKRQIAEQGLAPPE